jgi:hypothetical protein
VTDWEKQAIKRDKRFLVRLVILLAIGVLAGVLLLLSTQRVGGCAAQTFEQTTGDEAGSQ